MALLFLIPSAGAEVFVTEIMSNPPLGESEWVRIISDGEEEVHLLGFSLGDDASFAKGTAFFEIGEETQINKNEEKTLSGWGNILNNSKKSGSEFADTLYFWDSGKNLIAQIAIPPLEKGESCFVENDVCHKKEDPPEEEEIAPLSENSLSFVVTEILTNGESEWVKIKSTAEESQNIGGVMFADENSNFFTIPDETFLEAGVEMIFSGWSAKLNNDGDTLFVKNSSGEILAQIPLPKFEKEEVCIVENNACVKEEKPEELPKILLNPDTFFVVTEILTNGDAEWVKIKSTAEERQNIGGILFADESGDFFEIPAETILEAGAEILLSGWSAKLNNTGDTLFVKNSSGEILAQIPLPKLEKDEICQVLEGKCAGKEGSSGGGSSSGKIPPLIKTKAKTPSIGAEKITIRFSEVRFRSDDFDAIELFCEKCDADLAGLRLADDDTFFEFPEKTEVKSGDFIVIFLDGEEKDPEKIENAHFFHTAKKDLTATDETLFLIDSRGEIETAICIADQNGKFSPGEENDFRALARQGALLGIHPLNESVCADSRPLKKGISLVFFRDKKSPKHDSFWTESASFGEENPPPPFDFLRGMRIARIQKFSEETVILTIENTAKTKILTRGFRAEGNGEVVEVPEKTLYPSQKIRMEFPMSDRIFLKDFWGNIASEIGKENFEEFLEGIGDLQISEILPNPKGKDEGAEFVEFLCQTEKCDLENFILWTGKKNISFSQKSAKNGEYFVEKTSLKNEEGEIIIFDLEKGIFEREKWEKSPEGKSLVKGEWTDFPTPNAPNFFGKIGEDANRNNIPDEIDFALGEMTEKLFPRLLEKKVQWEVIQNEENEIVLLGTAPPKTEVFGSFGGEKFATKADKKGKIEIRFFQNIKPKKREMRTTAKLPSGHFVFQKKEFFNTKNPQENWIQNLEIVGVLPNPEGKDTNAEKIILRNNDEKDGWIKKMTIESGGKHKNLPEIWIKAEEEIELSKKEIPSLKNKNGEILLKNADGRVLSQVSWKNAKSGVFYGKNFPAETTATKSTKKKTKKESVEKEIFREEVFGKIIARNRKIMILEQENGEKKVVFLGDAFDVATIDQLVAEKTAVKITLVGNSMNSLTREFSEKSFISSQKNNSLSSFEAFLATIGVFAFLIFGMTHFLIFWKKRRMVKNDFMQIECMA